MIQYCFYFCFLAVNLGDPFLGDDWLFPMYVLIRNQMIFFIINGFEKIRE